MKTIFLFIILGFIVLGFIASAIKGEKEKSYKRGYKDAYRMYKSTGVIPVNFNPGDDIEDKVSYKIGFYDATTEMRRE